MTTLAHPSAEAALDLLERARGDLVEASHTPVAATRYLRAQLAALRAAAAVVAARCVEDPAPGRGHGARNLWDLLPGVAPELTEWAVFFAGPTRDRARIERGEVAVAPRAADDLLRQAEAFLLLVAGSLGLPLPAAPVDELAPLTQQRRQHQQPHQQPHPHGRPPVRGR